MYELKPCPFCGKQPVISKDKRYPWMKNSPINAYEIFCDNYDCIIYHADNTYFRHKEEAIEAWNRRVEE